MTDVGEKVAVTLIKDEKDAKYHSAGLQLCYPNGKPYFADDFIELTTEIAGNKRTDRFNLECAVHQSLLEPGTKVSYVLEPNADAKVAAARKEVKQALDRIIEAERDEQKMYNAQLQSEHWALQGLILTGAFMSGVGEGAMGLVEFVGDTAVLAGKTAWYSTQVQIANNLEAAWETAYSNGDLKDFYNSVGEKNVEDFATAFGITPKKLVHKMAEAYEIMAFVTNDGATKSLLMQFAEDYVKAQSKVEMAKIGGSAAFDIILTAVLAVTTGGVGNAAQAGAKVRHFAYFKKLAEKLSALTKELKLQNIAQEVKGQLDEVVKKTVKAPPKQKLEVKKSKVDEQADTTLSDTQPSAPASSSRANDPSKSGSTPDTGNTETSQPGTDKNGQTTPPDAKTKKSGEPISLVTGEEMLTLTDFELQGPLPLAWQRTYKSGNPDNIGLGYGWTHSFAEHLQIDGDKVELHNAEARIVPFANPAVGAHCHNTAEKLQLRRIGFSQYSLRDLRPGAGAEKIFTATDGRSRVQLTQMRDPFGNRYGFDYDTNGRLQAIKASHGAQWALQYNQQNTVAAITLQLPGQQPKMLVQYNYNELNDLVEATDVRNNSEHYAYKNHIIAKRTLKSGYSFYFEWDRTDNKARCLRQWGDPIDGKPTYDYRFQWQPEARRVAITDTRGGVEVYQFNERGLPVYHRDQEGGETHTRYDQQGNVTRIKTPAGKYKNFAYDPSGNLQLYADPLGFKTHLRRDDNGNITEVFDPLGQRWRRKYNPLGQVIEQSNPLGESLKYQYNELGLISSITNPLGKTWHYLWDNQGQLNAIRSPEGQHTRYSYTSEGELARVTAPDNNVTQYKYDEAGNCTAIKTPDGQVQKFTYNSLGLLTSVTDQSGRTTQYQYNGLSQVVRRVDPNGQILRYHYDGERNLVGLTNEKGEHYRLDYDLNERLVQEVGFDGRVQRYHYDADGNLHTSEDYSPDGRTLLNQVRYERDLNGRLLQQIQGLGQQQSVTHFAYDPLGRLLEAQNTSRRLRWKYDAAGRVAEDLQDSHSLKHQYNAAGLRTQSTLPDGSDVAYRYSDVGAFTGLSINGQEVANIQRDALGRELQRTLGNQLVTESRYDPQGRLVAQRTGKQQADQPFKAISQRRLHYNQLGQLAQIDDQIRGSTRYHYDALDRLTQVDGPNPEAFVHDPAGNILASHKPGEQPQLGEATGNRLTMHGDSHFAYDALGNRIATARGKDRKLQTRYKYNGLNQLVAINNNGRQTHYQYDPLGRRISKTSAERKTEFLWLEDVLLRETEHNLTDEAQPLKSKTYLFEPGTFKPLAFVEDSEVYHYHLDHLGTPQEITNAQGKIVWAVSYRAYGNLAVAYRNEVKNNLRFQGQYFDEESGLHYNRFRYYDPACGRFVNQDPIGLLGGSNSYLYVPNPTGWVDPFGLTAEKEDPGRARKALEQSKRNDDQLLIDEAVAWQGPQNKGYPHKDTYSGIADLRTGDTIYGLYPGQGQYYTTQSTVDEFGHSSRAMNEALQVWPSDFGQQPGEYRYRPALAKYRVVNDTRAPIGPVAANTQWGDGGGTQIFIKDYESSLELIEVKDLPDSVPAKKVAEFRSKLDK